MTNESFSRLSAIQPSDVMHGQLAIDHLCSAELETQDSSRLQVQLRLDFFIRNGEENSTYTESSSMSQMLFLKHKPRCKVDPQVHPGRREEAARGIHPIDVLIVLKLAVGQARPQASVYCFSMNAPPTPSSPYKN